LTDVHGGSSVAVMKNVETAKEIWDVVVVGGGAAGMMAASTARREGASVLLLEKNTELGKKLAITGGGRCNVTNNKPNVRTMLDQYQTAGKFLFSTFTQHGVAESIEWFQDRGVPFKEENEGRLFPQTESAITIVDTLKKELVATGVTVRRGAPVKGVVCHKAVGQFILTLDSGSVTTRSLVLATGGTARPETGSTGDGFAWLRSFGHEVKANDSALVPLTLATAWTKKLSGLTLSNVKISLYAFGKKQLAKQGRMLFTHVGVTGPLILNMSKAVSDHLQHSPVVLMLDLFPEYDAGALKDHLKTLLASNKKLANALSSELPRQLVRGILSELAIDEETPCHSVSSEDRKRLLVYLKQVPLPVKGLLGADKAIVSSGGVVLEEIDFKTMESRLIPRLFITGDLLHINRPSGGYSLQLCWSTGFVAGRSAARAVIADH
jgi:predicted Rossmann fold flavoprotein